MTSINAMEESMGPKVFNEYISQMTDARIEELMAESRSTANEFYENTRSTYGNAKFSFIPEGARHAALFMFEEGGRTKELSKLAFKAINHALCISFGGSYKHLWREKCRRSNVGTIKCSIES